MAPELKFVFEACIDLGAPLEIGILPSGSERRVIPILGGTLEGFLCRDACCQAERIGKSCMPTDRRSSMRDTHCRQTRAR
jgi:hypothetical protein